jgi:hypothetical protein
MFVNLLSAVPPVAFVNYRILQRTIIGIPPPVTHGAFSKRVDVFETALARHSSLAASPRFISKNPHLLLSIL